MKEFFEKMNKYFLKKFLLLSSCIVATALPGSFLFAEDGIDVKSDLTLMDGLVSYWPLDEESGMREDVHGENDLNPETSVIQGVGILRYGVDFENSKNEALEILDSTQNGLDISGDMTVSIWFRAESFTSGDGQALVTKWEHTNNNQYHFDVSQDHLNIHIADSCTGYTYVKKSWSHSMVSEKWYHITYVYNALAGSAEAFINGSSLGLLTGFPNSIANCSAKFKIGDRDDFISNEYHFDGVIDEVGIWNRALTAEEVAKLYNNGKGLPYEASVEPPAEGASSIAFLPGITGSRLYRPEVDWNGFEDKIWESIKWKDVQELGFTESGQSLYTDIYTRDIVDVVRPLTGWWDYAEGYLGWKQFLDRLVADDVIKQWKAIPYDWRLATDDLVTLGEETSFDKISYLTGEQDMPYIIGQIEAIADGSPTGKATVVAHSNGGLVIKNILRYLEETGDVEMLAKIDTVVLVAVPQLGTPKTLGELLHGTIPFAHSAAREALEDMPGAYGLLPSPALYASAGYPVIEFDERVANVPAYKDLANVQLSTYEGMTNFLSDVEGLRTEPDIHNLSTPNVLKSTLLEKAENMHEGIDAWESPQGIRVIELVGTGLPTVNSIHYSDCAREHCPATNTNYLSHEWHMTSEGDGTVIAKSAEGGEADETYYVALDRYNAGVGTAYSHGTILSVPTVQEFIKDNVIGDDTALPLLMGTDITKAGTYPRFEIRAYSPIDMHLYQEGEHTGVIQGDIDEELGREYEQEIPNSYYEEWGYIKYIGADFSQGPVELRVAGTGEGLFTLVIDVFDGDTKTGSFVFRDVAVNPDSEGIVALAEGEVPIIQYDFDGDGVFEREVTVGDAPQSVEEHFTLLKNKLQEIAFTKSVGKWLLGKVEVAEKVFGKGSVGNMRATEVILSSVLRAIEGGIAQNLDEDDTFALIDILQNILELVRAR